MNVDTVFFIQGFINHCKNPYDSQQKYKIEQKRNFS